MTAIEIILLMAGFICVCVSFFIGKKKTEGVAGVDEAYSRQLWSENDDETVKERVEEIVNDKLSDVSDMAEDILNKKSNEKIMEFEDYASQVLERVEQNQQEVVFMYNMLLEKENEIKPVMAGINSYTVNNSMKQSFEGNKNNNTTEKMADSNPNKPVKNTKRRNIKTAPNKVIDEELEKEQLMALENMGKAEDDSKTADKEIIRMHRAGKSIVEISKTLGIGQGEVQLIISLYGGKM